MSNRIVSKMLQRHKLQIANSNHLKESNGK